ncbi:MAG: hypothetical protein XD78_1373 [Desulfotomaculum sp. 46_296]|nr:MAG: hypothetical protein XD78_1373 [Desulfotomaculum sp. 46_296]HAU32761.1 hypothetical protein [Desulfotomaculum sp.]
MEQYIYAKNKADLFDKLIKIKAYKESLYDGKEAIVTSQLNDVNFNGCTHKRIWITVNLRECAKQG